MKEVRTDAAPAPVGPYSQAVEQDGWIFASGQIPIDPSTGKLVDAGIEEQTRCVLANLQAVLEAAAKWMEETGDAEDAGINKSEIARQDKQGIKTIAFTGADGETYLKRAMETAWEAVKKASPEHGEALHKLLAR